MLLTRTQLMTSKASRPTWWYRSILCQPTKWLTKLTKSRIKWTKESSMGGQISVRCSTLLLTMIWAFSRNLPNQKRKAALPSVKTMIWKSITANQWRRTRPSAKPKHASQAKTNPSDPKISRPCFRSSRPTEATTKRKQQPRRSTIKLKTCSTTWALRWLQTWLLIRDWSRMRWSCSSITIYTISSGKRGIYCRVCWHRGNSCRSSRRSDSRLKAHWEKKWSSIILHKARYIQLKARRWKKCRILCNLDKVLMSFWAKMSRKWSRRSMKWWSC